MARVAQHADVLALEDHLPRGRLGDAADHVEQFRLAVAGDAGDADDLAGRARVKETLSTRAMPFLSFQVRFFTSSTVSPGLRRALLDAQQHAAADHELGQFLDVGVPASRASPPSRRGA